MYYKVLALAAVLAAGASVAQGQDVAHQKRASLLAAPITTSPHDSASKKPFATGQLLLALGVDANGRTQNEESVKQIGDLATIGRIRIARATAVGTLGRNRPWKYRIGLDASGLYADHLPVLTVKDLAMTAPIGGHAQLTLGRQKEGITINMLESGRGLAFAERAASIDAFVPKRNDGLRLWGSVPNSFAGWTIGVFDNWIFNHSSLRLNEPQVAARMFWAPIHSRDSSRVVHLGIDARWTGNNNGGLAFKARPEQNAAPNFVNTGTFSASNATTVVGEFMVLHRDLSLVAEVLPTQTNGTWDGSLDFLGYYAELSWRPHGEIRPYEAGDGTLGRVRLQRRLPAWELAVRFSRTDLDDHVAQGGVLDIPSFAVSMFGPSWTRLIVNYGFTALAKSGHVGRAQLLTVRAQWERR